MDADTRVPTWRAQAAALTWVDLKVLYNLRLWVPVLLLGGLLALLVVFDTRPLVGGIPARPDFLLSDPELAGVTGGLLAFGFLGGASGTRLSSVAMALVDTLPVDRRAAWAYASSRVTLLVGILVASCAAVVGYLAVSGMAQPVVQRAAGWVGALLAFVLAVQLGSLSFLWLKHRAKAARAAVWLASSVFAAAPPAVYLVTGDPTLAGWAAGPWMAAAVAVGAASATGLVGALVLAFVYGAASLGFVMAPLPRVEADGRDLDEATGVVISRFPAGAKRERPPPQAPPSARDPDERGTGSQQRMWEAMRAEAAGKKTDMVLQPLDVPEGRLEALRFFLSRRVPRWNEVGSWVIALIITAAIFVWPFLLPEGLLPEQPDQGFLRALFPVGTTVWLLFSATEVYASGRRIVRTTPAGEGKDDQDDEDEDDAAVARAARTARVRPRPAFFRSWRTLQTVPVTAREIEGAIRPGFWNVVAAAILLPSGAGIIAALALGAPPLWTLLMDGFFIGVFGAILSIVGPVALTESPVRPRNALPHRVWRWTPAILWTVGAAAAIFACAGAIQPGLRRFAVTEDMGPPLLLLLALAAAGAWMVWRGRLESHVQTERPLETPGRMFGLFTCGAMVASIGVAALFLV